jgi:hypothetical protein
MKPKPPPRLPISPVLNPFLVATLQGRPDYLGQQWERIDGARPLKDQNPEHRRGRLAHQTPAVWSLRSRRDPLELTQPIYP